MPLRTAAATYERIYVFGDSLSDTGNAFNATLALTGTGIPQPPYVDGRFSNGFVWIDYLAEDLEVELVPYATVAAEGVEPTEGINFAVGGAIAGTSDNDLIPGLQEQIRYFTSLIPAGQNADPDALYMIWIGANDYLREIATDSSEPLASISEAVTTLANLGAQNILVANLPNLGLLPATHNDSNAQALNQVTASHNAELATALNNLKQNLSAEINLVTLDINTLFNRAIAGEFGFVNVTDACFNRSTGAVCSNPDGYLFWDGIHPTTAAHRQVKAAALAALQPAPAANVPNMQEPIVIGLGVLAVGIGGAAWGMRRKMRQ